MFLENRFLLSSEIGNDNAEFEFLEQAAPRGINRGVTIESVDEVIEPTVDVIPATVVTFVSDSCSYAVLKTATSHVFASGMIHVVDTTLMTDTEPVTKPVTDI